MDAVAVVVLGALLGGVVRAGFEWRDREREGRAAARVVWDALTASLKATHFGAGQSKADRRQDFTALASVWDEERKALARTLDAAGYAEISGAFAALRVVATFQRQRADAPPRTQVIDSDVFNAAAKRCENGRRIAWRASETRRSRVRRWVAAKRKERSDRRGLRRNIRAARKIRRDD